MTSQSTRKTILIVDDEMVIRDVLEDFLSSEGYDVVTVSNGHSALNELESDHYDAVLSDLMMPEMTGLELIAEINNRGYKIITIIMTGYGTIETAVAAMKSGAFDYILKPFKMDEVLSVLDRSFERLRLQQENVNLKETLNLYRISETIAKSREVDSIFGTILDATEIETDADYILLYLGDRSMDGFSGLQRFSARVKEQKETIKINVDGLSSILTDDGVFLENDEIKQYFNDLPTVLIPRSLCCVPLKVPGGHLGFLLVVSFTRKIFFREGHRKFLSILGSRAATSYENARLFSELKDTNNELTEANRTIKENFRQTIVGFARAIEQNDPYTRGHSDRVAVFSRLIAEQLDLPLSFVEDITFAGQLHDIGKIGISSQKLNKTGKLNAPEIRMFRKHPEMGKRILEPIPFMRHLISGVYCHHEKYDGTGYPQGLAGDEIPLMGRIIAVADTYDAMTSDRSYRKALNREVAIHELEINSGTQFDPDIVRAFLVALEKSGIEDFNDDGL
ncbi:response regulator [Myxococcota bacterium]|nr:response regulator [Myxococcota bacterium]MBU1383083.1 response regulator [Myxococcota bacterium]MBU1498256.1 response regulator [Myxococcota bacterium]